MSNKFNKIRDEISAKQKTKISKKAFAAIAAILLVFLMASSMILPSVHGDTYFAAGTQIPTYALINVAPNPIGVGQTVNVNFFLATAIQSGEGPTNMTVEITDPNGNTQTKGPYAGDPSGGSHFDFAPDKVGNWTFQFFYGGQTTTQTMFGMGYGDLKMLPSESKPYTLTVQQDPITQTAYPITPLPTSYWETPVSAENVQEWYQIMGPWLGTGTLSGGTECGLYNATSTCNPFTDSVMSGHVLWTKPWGPGGVVGGDAGGNEVTGSYWTTRQYWEQFAPVIMDGKLYAQWYPETTGYSNGIVCTDLFTGQTDFIINTTSTLLCGMITQYKTANSYGAIGPYLWTTGTLSASETGGNSIVSVGVQFNLFSATTGKYVLSVVNSSIPMAMGATPTLKSDANGNLIGYYVNSTVGGTQSIYEPGSSAFAGPQLKEVVNINTPVLCCFNMTQAIGNGWGWSPTLNTAVDFDTALMWAQPIPTNISGVPISPALSFTGYGNNELTGNVIILDSGELHGSNQSPGYMVLASMDQDTGNMVMCKNFTYPEYKSLAPFTRYTAYTIDGFMIYVDYVTWECDAIDLTTGAKVWTATLQTPYGDGTPNIYGTLGGTSFTGIANGKLIISSFGGDIWAINPATGKQLWYTNTTTLIGNPGIESPYGIWPIWQWCNNVYTKDVGYFTIGHMYDPPLFHGAQMIALNLTDGQLIWNELGQDVMASAIAYNTLVTLNQYDNQIYAYAKGPTSLTVNAPSVGVSTTTPITITGTVTDVSAGSQQSQVEKNFPNGLPCVSDASQSKWMEYVYQDQPLPTNATGVPVTISVLDSNNNFREIGTTTSNIYGTYSLTWTPDIPGNYTVIANFAGSNSYYPSSASTAFYASAAVATVPTVTAQANVATTTDLMTYIVGAAIAIIIVMVIIGVLMLRKRP